VAEERAAGRGRPWLRAWLVVGLAAWAQVGVTLVDRAQRQGLVEDISFSPYHLVGYAALLTLAVYVGWAFFRALRRGSWRTAFPPLYGGLGVAFVLLIGWVVLDIVWRSTLGINPGIEGGLAPPRLLIPAALALLAVGPLREAIADRARRGLSPGELSVRWAGVVGAALIGGALTQVVYNPVRDPINDFSVNPGVDASEIWTMNPDGEGQTRLLQAFGDGVDYSLPAWSPDGDRIAYTVWTNFDGARQNIRNEDQFVEIWTMAADGSDRRVVFDNRQTTPAGQAWIPAWSPDGQWIAYTLSPVGPQPASAAQPEANPAPGQIGPPTGAAGASIWIVHPDGTRNTRLTAEGVSALNLVWAPDGTRVAYTVDTGAGTDIYVASINAGAPAADLFDLEPKLSDEHAITADDANDWGPAWSPDGKTVAFSSNRSGNDDIWAAPVDGGAPTQLTNNRAGDWVPAFSPDGTWIAFTSDRTGEPEVWLMAVDGSGPSDITNHPMHYDGEWSVSWAPDGNRIAYATGSFQDASSSGWVREDLAAAQALLFGLALAIVALLIVALGAPLGSFTLALTIVVAMGALPSDQWRFVPAAVIAGLVTDVLVRSVRLRHRARAAAAAFPALANLAIGLTIGAGGALAWSLTLLLGVAVASAVLGWALAEAVERLFGRPAAQGEAPAR
jgi:Tol biopolymer transport system component